MRKTTIFLILSTLLLSLFLFLVAKPQAYINAFSDNLNHGNYDAIITGPISASQYNLLESQPDIAQLSPAFVIRAKVINKTETEISQIFFADDPNQFSKSSNYNKQLLLEGSFENQHSVISYDLAKNLNLQIGDEFQIEIAGNIYNSTVSGIFKKAQGVSKVIIADRKLIDLNDPNVTYTFAYIKYQESLSEIEMNEQLKKLNITLDPRIMLVTKKNQIKQLHLEALELKKYEVKYLIACTVLVIILFTGQYFSIGNSPTIRKIVIGILQLTVGLLLVPIYFKILYNINISPFTAILYVINYYSI